MKCRSAAAALTAGILLTAHSAAYGIFCEDKTAESAMSGFAERLASVAEQFEQTINAPEPTVQTAEISTQESTAEVPPENTAAELYTERLGLYSDFLAEQSAEEYALAEKLIDYDLLLDSLKTESGRYAALKENAENLAEQYLIGGCTREQLDGSEKQRSDKYYELQSLLFDIGSMKSEIEALISITLTSDFDFSCAFLITDALELSPDKLSGWGVPGTICVPEGAEYSPETADLTAQYNEAVQSYYTLGSALRDYVATAGDYNSAAEEARLGTVSADQLSSLKTAYEDARAEALKCKADYSKSLLRLDSACGGALTAANAASPGLFSAFRSALPEGLRGKGLWTVRRSGGEARLYIAAYPFSFDPEKDSVNFELTYSGKKLGGAFSAPDPVGGQDKAEISFTKNGVPAGKYEIDIYSPFGGFLED